MNHSLLGIEDITPNKTANITIITELTFQWEKRNNKQIFNKIQHVKQ